MEQSGSAGGGMPPAAEGEWLLNNFQFASGEPWPSCACTTARSDNHGAISTAWCEMRRLFCTAPAAAAGS